MPPPMIMIFFNVNRFEDLSIRRFEDLSIRRFKFDVLKSYGKAIFKVIKLQTHLPFRFSNDLESVRIRIVVINGNGVMPVNLRPALNTGDYCRHTCQNGLFLYPTDKL